MRLYDQHVSETKGLMLDKNHDYDEAWRSMRVSSYTDIILMKLPYEGDRGVGTNASSEGVDANYKDMINYAIFALMK